MSNWQYKQKRKLERGDAAPSLAMFLRDTAIDKFVLTGQSLQDSSC